MADEEAQRLIQEEKFLDFNNYVEKHGGAVDLSDAHLRSYDMRKCNLQKANFNNAYLRSSDLRGADLSEATLEGASMKEAKISGVKFPRNYSSNEIMMSIQYGTRLRPDM